jgi:hypothetical protein
MGELTANVSWLGVIVGAIVAFLLGWLWFSPKLFGTKWAEGVGVEMGTANEMPMGAMGAQALGLLLMSWFVGVTAVNNAALTVLLATVAFTVLAWSGGAFAKKSVYSRNVEAGYWIAALVVMFACQGIF